MKKFLLCSIVLIGFFNSLIFAQTVSLINEKFYRDYYELVNASGGAADQHTGTFNVFSNQVIHGGKQQQWAIMPLYIKVKNGVIEKSREHVIGSRINGRTLDFATGSGHNLYCNTNFQGGSNQIFTFFHRYNNTYEIHSPFNVNGALDKAGNHNIYFGSRHGGNNQQFRFANLYSFPIRITSLRSIRTSEIPRPAYPTSFTSLVVKETAKTFVSETLIPYPMVKNDLSISIQVENTPYYKLVKSQYYKQPEHFNSDITYYPGETVKRSLTEKWGMKSSSVTEVETKLRLSFTSEGEVTGKISDLLSLKASSSISEAFEMNYKTVNTYEASYEKTQVLEYTFSPSQAIRLITYQLIDYYQLYRSNNTLVMSWEVQTAKNIRTSYPAESGVIGGRSGRPSYEVEIFPLISTSTNELDNNPDLDTEEVLKSINLKVYPNPTPGSFTLEFNKISDADHSLIIYNSLGTQISMEQIISNSNVKHVDISHLPSGLYLIKLIAGSGAVTKYIYKE